MFRLSFSVKAEERNGGTLSGRTTLTVSIVVVVACMAGKSANPTRPSESGEDGGSGWEGEARVDALHKAEALQPHVLLHEGGTLGAKAPLDLPPFSTFARSPLSLSLLPFPVCVCMLGAVPNAAPPGAR